MPRNNHFRHQSYPTAPGGPVEFHELAVVDPMPGALAGLHVRHRISRVVLVHGTFMGADPFGISSTLNALADSLPLAGGPLRLLAAQLQERTQPLVTRLARDLGNYTQDFQLLFQQLVGDDPQIEFPQTPWSSENHHLARAELAVMLLEQLLSRPLAEDQRVLFWGHSHAGNAFAILSNLLANHPESVDRFFAAAGCANGCPLAVRACSIETLCITSSAGPSGAVRDLWNSGPLRLGPCRLCSPAACEFSPRA
jgi:hypothetical protein